MFPESVPLLSVNFLATKPSVMVCHQWAVDIWILIPALLSDAIALIKGMGKGDFRVGHAIISFLSQAAVLMQLLWLA